jgi:hypothetical protein
MNRVFTVVCVVASGWLVSCSSSSADKHEELISESEQMKPTLEESRYDAQNVFVTLPDKRIINQLIDEKKIEYDHSLLADPKAVNNYPAEFYKAANLGFYGSDLIIASSFNQTQESMIYLKCVNILAQSLGVSSAFDQTLFERIEANKDRKDSVLSLVTGAFKRVDEILKYNNRPGTSAIILTGCWIEGLYVSAHIASKLKDEKTNKTLIDQRESLKNLIVMLNSIKLETNQAFLLEDLKALFAEFVRAESAGRYDAAAIQPILTLIDGLHNKLVKPAN